MSTDRARVDASTIVAELARVTAYFQARAIATHLGAPMPDPAAFRREVAK